MSNSEIAKGFSMELLCLAILNDRAMYSYELVQEIIKRSDELLNFSKATVYVALYRLEEKKLIQVTESNDSDASERRIRSRVYYCLTEAGQAKLGELVQDFYRINRGVDILLKRSGVIGNEQ